MNALQLPGLMRDVKSPAMDHFAETVLRDTRNWLVQRGESRLPAPVGRFDMLCLLAGGAALLLWSLWSGRVAGAGLVGAGAEAGAAQPASTAAASTVVSSRPIVLPSMLSLRGAEPAVGRPRGPILADGLRSGADGRVSRPRCPPRTGRSTAGR